MTAPSTASDPLPVRDDLLAAHRRVFEDLARPGCWWTGAERIAIAAETRSTRDCALCRERKAALSPSGGTHAAARALPTPAVEVIHRVVTDPGRLSRGFYEQALAGGLGDGAYVELLGVVVRIVCVDAFRRAIGAAPHPLPPPAPGAPSRYRPPGAKPDVAWVAMIAPGAESEAEADLYTEGRPPNVGRALSLVPDAVRGMKDLVAAQYVPLDRVPDARYAGRTLSRTQMELLAGRVSALNQCFY
jgi:hypothetical protein